MSNTAGTVQSLARSAGGEKMKIEIEIKVSRYTIRLIWKLKLNLNTYKLEFNYFFCIRHEVDQE